MEHAVPPHRSSPPSYYMMDDDRDIFRWLESVEPPELPFNIALPTSAIWATAFRYVRRCLWKEGSLRGKAQDARKAATCLLRLAELLEETHMNLADEGRTYGS